MENYLYELSQVNHVVDIPEKIAIPEKVAFVIEQLEKHGYEAFAVGGCVRDSILGREPGDWDITTSALPEQVKQVFARTVDTGIAHGTVTVLIGKEGFEVTTYRIDGEYEDARHPKSVEFTRNLAEDLARRDFTINAMAYNPTVGFVDMYDGMDDLKRGIIRCVGVAKERFTEDALRIMRAVRFAAQLGFEIEEETAAAVKEIAPNLRNVSAERIQVELMKLLTSPNPQLIHLAYELGITKIIMPEYDAIVGVKQNTPNHCYTVDEHTLRALMEIKAEPALRLTMLMHDFGKPIVKKTDDGRDIFYKHPEVSAKIAKTIMRRLKFDNFTTDKVVRLVQWHGLKYYAEPVHIRRALNRVGADIFADFILVQRADVSAKDPKVIAAKLAALDEKEAIYHQIIERGDCFSIKGLDINGKDLIGAGIEPGPLLGAVLERLVERVIDAPELNKKEILLELALKEKDSEDIFAPKEYFFVP